jgi:hypothetical protein
VRASVLVRASVVLYVVQCEWLILRVARGESPDSPGAASEAIPVIASLSYSIEGSCSKLIDLGCWGMSSMTGDS